MSRNIRSQPKAKSIFLTIVLSIIPGLGHLYLGQNFKGVLLLLPSFFLIPMFVTIPLSIIDGIVMAKRTMRGCLLERWEWFWSSSADFGLKFVEFVLIRRIEEPIGKDTREVTNQSNEEIEREIKLSREWTFKYTIQQEVSRKITDVNSIKMRDGANRSRTIEDFFREQYSYEKGQKIVSTEIVRIRIPGKKKITLKFLWKNIVEIGSIVLRDSKQNEFILPYNAIVGVSFDIEQSETSLT